MKKLIIIFIILLAAGLTSSRAQVTFGAPQTNPFGLANMGLLSTPALTDLDGDGDMDLMTGSQFGIYYYFENSGNASAPVFAPEQANPFGIGGTIGYSAPAFADLDGDGDVDFLEGDGYLGDFYYYQNNGTASAPAFIYSGTNPFGITNMGFAALMFHTFSDLDGDGDLDLMAGNQAGNFFYFQNTGTAFAPSFAPVQINPFGLTNIGNSCCSNEASPSFVDLDKDGDMDLMSGSSHGEFHYFQNIGTASNPSFAASQLNPFGLMSISSDTSPSFADLDADGDMDLMLGEVEGNYFYFENTPLVAVICPLPVNLSVSNVTGTTAKLKWDAVAGAEGYKVRFKVANTSEWKTGVTYSNSKPINGLSPNTTYKWEVQTYCQFAPKVTSDWSSKQEFTTGSLRMDDESAQQISLSLYPNPAEAFTTIQFTLQQASHITIRVYDVRGKEITTLLDDDAAKGNHSLLCNTAQFSKGIYFVKMISDFGIENQKLIVQ